MAWLRRMAAQVELIESRTCCGMGSSFGLKMGHWAIELSQAVGESLFYAFQRSGSRRS